MTSHSNKYYHQDQIKHLEDQAGKKLEKLLEVLNLSVELRKARNFYVGKCPIHGGDRNNAFNIFHTGNKVVGNWRCFTGNCHKIFQPTLTGFIRGFLSAKKYGWRCKADTDKECPFNEVLRFLCDFCDIKTIDSIKVDYEQVSQNIFTSQIENIYGNNIEEHLYKIPKNTVRNSLKIPCEYYINRGYDSKILDKYDIGFCDTPGKKMYMRAVVPIYDENGEYVIACSGRTIFDICPLCECHHNPATKCPAEDKRWIYSKWKHSKGFRGEYSLYNYWFAKEHIRKSGIVILVEGPGDVWRLEEAGINIAVATFGAHLTEGQRKILDKSGALHIIVLTDPDHAGKLASEQIKKELGNLYNLYFPTITNVDIGDTNIKMIRNKINPIIEAINRSYQ